MTSAAPGPNLGIVYGWAPHENTWDSAPSGGLDGDLAALDALVFLQVLSSVLAAPPGSPAAGDRYVIGASATGAWATHDHQVTRWNGTAWEFYAPKAGWIARQTDSSTLRYDGSAWQAGSIVVVSPGSASAPGLVVAGATDTAKKGVYDGGTDVLAFTTKGVGAGAFDANGNLLIGVTGPVATGGAGGTVKKLEIVGGAAFPPNILQVRASADTSGVQIQGVKSRGTVSQTGSITLGSIVSNDLLLRIAAFGDDGTTAGYSGLVAGMQMACTGTISAGIVPGSIVFQTQNQSGAAVVGFTIDQAQNLVAGSSNRFVDLNGIMYFRSYTRATLPTSGYTAGQQVWCSDLGGTGGMLVNTGTAWKRLDPLGATAATTTLLTGNGNFVYLTNAAIHRYGGVLTGNTTLTLTTADGSAGANTTAVGAFCRIWFNGTLGAFTFSVVNGGGAGGSKSMLANSILDFMFDGSNWNEVGGGSLP